MTHCPTSPHSPPNSPSTMKGKRMNRHHQKKKSKSIGGQEDRISALPDSILLEILSLIDTQSAVQTSVLSNRWRYLWTDLPNLHFRYSQFSGPNHHSKKEKRRFTNFVNQVLSLRNRSNVFSFSLECYTLVDPSFVDKCLCYAVSHNVQQLHFSVIYPRGLKFPTCFINSQSLKVLKLNYSYNYLSKNHSLRLPLLKTLHLEAFSGSHKFITNTVASCPNLETLVLRYLGRTGLLTITAPRLRRLDLPHPGDVEGIVVSAPMLTSFRYQGYALPVFQAAYLPCLEDAYVDLCSERFFPNEVRTRMALDAIKMLGQLREAKSVTLSLGTVEVLSMDPDSLKSHPSPFYKLKHLKLAASRKCSPIDLPLSVISYLGQVPKWQHSGC